LKHKKQTCFNKEIHPTSNEKQIIITRLLYNIEKVSSIYFLFTIWKKKLTKRKKKFKRKFFFENILKGKKK
jgi:hypothetical protein